MPLPHGGFEPSPTGLRIVIERDFDFDLKEIWNAFTTDSDYGAWDLGLELSRQDGVSTIRFIHCLGPTDDLSTIGPGWEYYVHRAIASLEGGDVESVKWDDYYPALAPAYTQPSE